jgi:hypothetical protein
MKSPPRELPTPDILPTSATRPPDALAELGRSSVAESGTLRVEGIRQPTVAESARVLDTALASPRGCAAELSWGHDRTLKGIVHATDSTFYEVESVNVSEVAG